jgi:hypothetical protein
MTYYLILVFLSLNANAVNCYEKYYDNYSVIRVIPETRSQLEFLRNWAQNLSFSQLSAIDFWRYPSNLNQNVDIMVSPNLKSQIIRLMKSENLNTFIMIENVQKYCLI